MTSTVEIAAKLGKCCRSAFGALSLRWVKERVLWGSLRERSRSQGKERERRGLLYQAVRHRADQPCGTLTLAGAFVGQTFALVHIFRHAHAHNVPPLLTLVSTECQRSTSVSTLLHAASVTNIMQLMQNKIVNLPVFRNSYFQRSYLHSLFITSPCCFKQSHKVTT